jgi:hypothetical protein
LLQLIAEDAPYHPGILAAAPVAESREKMLMSYSDNDGEGAYMQQLSKEREHLDENVDLENKLELATSHIDKLERIVEKIVGSQMLHGPNESFLALENATNSTNSTNSTAAAAALKKPTAAALSGVAQNKVGDMSSFLTSLGTALVFVAGATVFVGFMRKRYPEVYMNNCKLEHGPPPPPEKFFGFCRLNSIKEIIEHTTLDHGMFLEFCNFAMYLCLALGIPACFILAPINVFCGGDIAGADHLSYQGLDNVRDGSWIFWLAAAFVWYNVAVTELFMSEFMRREIIPRRIEWMKDIPRFQAVTRMAEGLPREVKDGEETVATEASVKDHFDNKVFGKSVVQKVCMVKDTSKLQPVLKELADLQRAFAEEKYNSFTGRLNTKLGLGDYRKDSMVSRIAVLEQEVKRQRAEMWASDEFNLPVAFITFEFRREAELALRLFDPSEDDTIVMFPAPTPSDVIWTDLESDLENDWEEWIGMGVIGGLYFAVLPTVMGCAVFVGHYVHAGAAILGALLLTQIMGLIPTVLGIIFRNFFTLRVHTIYQHFMQTNYFRFLLVFVLLVTCIGGSLLTTTQTLIKNPTSIFHLLAVSLPPVSHFYLSYLPIATTAIAMEFMRYVTWIKFHGLSHFYDTETARDMAEPEDQDYYGIGARSSRNTIMLVVAIVFSTISPVTFVVTIVYFAAARFFYDYLFVYAESIKGDLGGEFVVTQLEHIQYALYLYVGLMTGLLHERAANKWPAVISFAAFGLVYACKRRFENKFMGQFTSLPFTEIQKGLGLNARKLPKEDYYQPELGPHPEDMGTALESSTQQFSQYLHQEFQKFSGKATPHGGQPF